MSDLPAVSALLGSGYDASNLALIAEDRIGDEHAMRMRVTRSYSPTEGDTG